ncbi:MAG: hypothetical protein NTX42_05810 [Methanothrix sp.]|nr:hypothetical protein [Methanothrix sp.]
MLTLPKKIDWNNLNGKKWTTELRNQNPENKTVANEPKTCVAFGVLAALEALLKIHYYNDPDQSLDLSEGSLWTCGHRWAAKGYPDGKCSTWQDDTSVDPMVAWTIDPPLRYLKKFGVAAGVDSLWPSTCSTCVCAKSSPNTIITIAGIGKLDWKEELKKKLVMYGPVIAEYSLPDYGKHCVAIVGYDDDEGRFMFKDSRNNKTPFLSYNGEIPDIHSIEVYKPCLNIIDIPGMRGARELSLNIVKIEPTNLGNLAEVDPTLLPNLQSKYTAWYSSASGWLEIRPENPAGTISLPLRLAVPLVGTYRIHMIAKDARSIYDKTIVVAFQ